MTEEMHETLCPCSLYQADMGRNILANSRIRRLQLVVRSDVRHSKLQLRLNSQCSATNKN